MTDWQIDWIFERAVLLGVFLSGFVLGDADLWSFWWFVGAVMSVIALLVGHQVFSIMDNDARMAWHLLELHLHPPKPPPEA